MSRTSGRDSLTTVGEFGLIQRLRRQWPTASPRVVQGIGDDAAILQPSPGQQLLVSTDVFIEGVHFDLTFQSPRDVGFRAAAANLSDIAAMGGTPLYLLVSMAVPGHLPITRVRAWYRGLRDACSPYTVELIGGDTSSSLRHAFLSLTIMGTIQSNRSLTRNRAKVGDHVYVTGTLGDSHAGLHVLRTRANTRPLARLRGDERWLAQRHLRPTPRIVVGQLLARQGIAHAAIDLSDGLSGDVCHVCEESRVGADIWATALPLSSHLRTFAKHNEVDPVEFALRGGDDYELLFTAPSKHHQKVFDVAQKTKVSISRIGTIQPKPFGRRLTYDQGRTRPLMKQSYTHFR